jgi:protein phosphatase
VAAASHVGLVRKANQDAFGYSAEAHCFTICDGMGGAAGGEIASRVTVEAFLERMACRCMTVSPARLIDQAVGAANRILFTRAQREPTLHGMGTTFVGLVLNDRARAYIAHVGDSRCYLWRAGTLVRCTEDHSLVEEQVRLGQMTQAQAAASPLRNVITRAVGVRRTVAVEQRELATEPGDLFLLCSDGLTREVDEPCMARSLAKATAAEMATPMLCDTLVDAALKSGGADNITCLAVRVSCEPIGAARP